MVGSPATVVEVVGLGSWGLGEDGGMGEDAWGQQRSDPGGGGHWHGGGGGDGDGERIAMWTSLGWSWKGEV